METIADRLRRILDERKITQRELARLTGLHFNTINSYVSGKKEPGAEKLRKIADALNADLNWLIRGETFDQYKIRIHEEKHTGAQVIQNSTIHVGGDFVTKIVLPTGEEIPERRADYKIPYVAEIIRLVKKLTDEQRKKVVELIRTVFDLG